MCKEGAETIKKKNAVLSGYKRGFEGKFRLERINQIYGLQKVKATLC
jgi:hypothetical protein